MVVVRYPPSPTWHLHVWTLRTCLYNFLYAKKNNWKIIFRSEDTDKERSKKEFEDEIISGLKAMWLMDDSIPVFRQSERKANYKKYLEKLLESGDAYYCFMTKEELDRDREEQMKNKLPPRYSWKFRDYPLSEAKERISKWERWVIRLKTPESEDIIFNDLVKWETKINSRELDDFVIARSLNDPLYNFTVVVDDFEMWITHVLRGEDHISNTPKQILVYRALGLDIPDFWHFPLILNEDRSKMSKRQNKVCVDEYLKEWYLQEAILNFMALLWWNTSDEKEIYSLDELISVFSLEWVNKSSAIFDINKLDWLNWVYIKNLSLEDLLERISWFLNDDLKKISSENPEQFKKLINISHERLKKFSSINNEFVWLYAVKDSKPEMYPNARMKVTEESSKLSLEDVFPFIESLDEKLWNKEYLTKQMISFIESKWQKNAYYLWPMRVALTREQFSPWTMEVMDVLWKEESLKRIEEAIDSLG